MEVDLIETSAAEETGEGEITDMTLHRELQRNRASLKAKARKVVEKEEKDREVTPRVREITSAINGERQENVPMVTNVDLNTLTKTG